MRKSQFFPDSIRPVLREMNPGETASFPKERITVVRATCTELSTTYERQYSVKKDKKNPEICWAERIR